MEIAKRTGSYAGSICFLLSGIESSLAGGTASCPPITHGPVRCVAAGEAFVFGLPRGVAGPFFGAISPVVVICFALQYGEGGVVNVVGHPRRRSRSGARRGPRMVKGMPKTSTTLRKGARALRIPGRGGSDLTFGGANSFRPPLFSASRVVMMVARAKIA